MKKKSLIPGMDLILGWVCTVCDLIPCTNVPKRDVDEVWEMEGAAYEKGEKHGKV